MVKLINLFYITLSVFPLEYSLANFYSILSSMYICMCRREEDRNGDVGSIDPASYDVLMYHGNPSRQV
ncbi:uncharacterized protein BDW43DRAFT_288532 [Aspergillus alliaceus]|uniref:uncharacterized protein n=1 Tax=Petromyces alliaceus TaxID=209559 RepID=UPI0012A4087A|nr:uncharacterized protein BDW43DRAFT_288532 [Aspergillus alliaceus]KAB8229284.1 hypothetical protein BDW43DRAFT_288532 [Aspergillus alliaceus]